MSRTGKTPPAHGRSSGANRRQLLIGAAGLVAGGGLVVGFWPGGPTPTSHAYTLAPESVLDGPIRRAPAKVREAYRFAVANRELLNRFPCFCGCFEQDGHRGNADCYVEDIRPDGTVVFDYMSLG